MGYEVEIGLIRSRVIRGGAAVSGALCLVVVGTGPVGAQELAPEGGFDAINEVVPEVLDDGTVFNVESDAEVTTGDVEVVVPSDADDGISIEQPGDQSLTIGLPFADDAEMAETDEGITYDNGNGSSTVPLVKEDGVVQLITTIEGAAAPTEYAYDLDLEPGAVLFLTDTGGAEVRESDGLVIATVEAPWAYDANGAAVATHYEVVGDALVQVIAHDTAGVAYPVVADPKVSFGWAVYVRYSKSEVRSMTTGLRGAINDKTGFALILCGKIPHWGAKGSCMAVGVKFHTSIYGTFKAARDRNQCVEIQLAHVTLLPVVWKRYSC
jgi:hypothetical protein